MSVSRSPAGVLLIGIAAAVVSCVDGSNHAASPPGASRASTAGACWPVAPFQLLALEHGREWEPIAELGADGTFWRTKGKRPLGRLVGDVVVDASGATLFTCSSAHELIAPNGLRSRYDANDALADGRMRVAVADDGAVTMTAGAPGGGVRVVGPVRDARRTAVLLVLMTLMGGR